MHSVIKAWRTVLVGILLAGLTMGVYWRVLGYGFIRLDDGSYVRANPHVISGLKGENIAWAFRTGYASNWHPLTWLSHMLDAQCYGLNPRGHHLTSLLFHVCNALLLFALFRQMTGTLWRSALVAGLFGLHPLHVESVAWIAERKDVLSTFFFLLTLHAYVRYAKEVRSQWSVVSSLKSSAARYYVLSLVFFSLGLMSKPMVVTLPFVLLLLDYWPLQRFNIHHSITPALHHSASLSPHLLWEKLPFCALSLTSSIITFLVQNQGYAMVLQVPFPARLANAIASYCKYLGKAIWPLDLAIFYPHAATRFPASSQWPTWQIVAAAMWLAAVSLWAIYRARRWPWFVTGWFWYLGTLVPVIGLVQVGMQGMADRYTYIPLIGIFVCVVWGAAEGLADSRVGRMALGAAATAALAACLVLTVRQVGYWRDNASLFGHALAVNPDNSVALFETGTGFGERGEFGQAMAYFRAASKADPSYFRPYCSVGLLLEAQGKTEAAMEQYRAALRVAPWQDQVHNHLGLLLWSQGQTEEAVKHYEEALRLNPEYAEAHCNLGAALAAQGNLAAAMDHFNAALRQKPQYPEALRGLGMVLTQQGQFRQAIAAYQQALALKPDWPEVLLNLAWVLATAPQAELRDGKQAVLLAERARELSGGKQAQFWAGLDAAYAEAGRFEDAIKAAQTTRDLALAAGDKEAAGQAEARLALYRKGQAFHQ